MTQNYTPKLVEIGRKGAPGQIREPYNPIVFLIFYFSGLDY